MSHPVRQSLMSRVKPAWSETPRFKPVLSAMDFVLDAHDKLRDHHSALATNANLSPIGRLDEVRSFTKKTTGPAIHRARAAAMSTTADIAAWRKRLLPAPPDQNNVVAAVLREGMRKRLFDMAAPQRAKVLVDPNIDPMLVQAILEAPEFLTGVSDQDRKQLIDAIVRRTHPTDLAAIAEMEEAVELLNAATGVTVNTAKSITEFAHGHLFESLIGPATQTAVPDNNDRHDDLLRQLGDLHRKPTDAETA